MESDGQKLEACSDANVKSIKTMREVSDEEMDSPPRAINWVKDPSSAGNIVVTAIGPVLGSMDSPEIETTVACTMKGIMLTASITRSPFYAGSAMKNGPWRPRVEIVIAPTKSEMELQVVWEMRSNSGVTPYAKRAYPMVITSTIRVELH